LLTLPVSRGLLLPTLGTLLASSDLALPPFYLTIPAQRTAGNKTMRGVAECRERAGKRRHEKRIHAGFLFVGAMLAPQLIGEETQ
jgi:hypothetical protein